MSTLFPIKLHALLTHLDKKGLIVELNKPALAMEVNAPADDLVRLVLFSPGVHTAIKGLFNFENGYYRIRFAIPPVISELFMRSYEARLELYDTKGEPIGQPLLVKDMPQALSSAIESELMGVLLKTCGIIIPTL